MKIKTADLLSIIDILKSNIESNFEGSINIEKEDFYWEISEEELYDPTSSPEDMTLGQLTDDWSELLRLKEAESIPISYDLRRLAVILQAVRKNSSGRW